MKWSKLCLLLLPFLLCGCGLQEREQALNEREARLARQQQLLLELENRLNLQEAQLQKKQQHLDSTLIDTTAHYNPNVVGTWNAVMTCTETTCPGSAIGDTKSEVWEFSYENNYLVAKAMSGSNVVRIYSGSFRGNRTLELTATVEATRNAPATKMFVRLSPTPRNTLEGQREIVREGGCKILYSLLLSK